MDESQQRITKNVAWLMVGVAILLEVISIIPVAQWFTDAAQAILFPTWFFMRGVSFFKKKNYSMLWFELGIILLEAIPVVGDILPTIVIGVVRNILFARKQDRLAAIAEQKAANQAEVNDNAVAGRIGPDTSERPAVAGRIGPASGGLKRKAA